MMNGIASAITRKGIVTYRVAEAQVRRVYTFIAITTNARAARARMPAIKGRAVESSRSAPMDAVPAANRRNANRGAVGACRIWILKCGMARMCAVSW
jgi:hypothetical protein